MTTAASLPRFLSVATPASRNHDHQTCGRLLGMAQKSKFVVATLAIPEQHLINDTRTIDEEELVMESERGICDMGSATTPPRDLWYGRTDVTFPLNFPNHDGEVRILSVMDPSGARVVEVSLLWGPALSARCRVSVSGTSPLVAATV
ncbi:hypothetical protein BU15DRAFT_63395 [Melanogaster broomeanus]|nr:hypothetical protein BU15DRAFT_63395 [Melanogaster broomeanus]